jgi:hypothetical protein
MAVAPLGCTTANLATGETCAHEVAVTLSADAQGAYVLGPRGLAIVRLGNLSTAAASGLRRASAASATPTPWRTITRKPLQP